jgi:hypothetical protein
MLKYQSIIRRFCHHHSRDIPKLSNPLVECENRHKCINQEIKIQPTKPLPIQVQYYKNNKLYKIVIEVPT